MNKLVNGCLGSVHLKSVGGGPENGGGHAKSVLDLGGAK